MYRLFLTFALMLLTLSTKAKSVVVYYSFTNNIHSIVDDLCTQIDADVIRIEPAEKGIDYAANGYAAGSALISAIRNHPNDASSYPAIDPIEVDVRSYDMIIIATPLWWSNMAAPMQTFLFQHGKEMDGKPVGLIVSSASSGISSVVADAKRLIAGGVFVSSNLWIRSSQTSNCHNMIRQWLSDIHFEEITNVSNLFNQSPQCSVEITTKGINITGDFDTYSVFNTEGHKLLETSASSKTMPFTKGDYVVRIKKNNQFQTIKTIAR